MKTPPSPTTTSTSNNNSPGTDDYSYYYNFFQDAITSLPSLPLQIPSQSKKYPRREPDGGGPNPSGDDTEGSKKKRAAATQLFASLLMLEDQEKTEQQQEWDRTFQQDLALFEAHHHQKAQPMLNYHSDLQVCSADLDESNGRQAKRRRVAAVVGEKVGAGVGAEAEAEAEAAPHHRRLWVKDRSRAWWDRCNHPDFPESEFRKAFRMGRATFEMICQELGSAVAKEDTMLRAAIPVRQRVAVCIWRLATGEPLRLVSKRFGLGISTCHKLVLEVCSAIKTVIMPRFLTWPSEDDVETIKNEFETISSGIPSVVGSMYTTHIPIIAPKISVAAYFNRRQTERNQKASYSVTVQGVVNPNGVFTDVCIGWPGSMSDDQVLEKSALHKRASGGMLKSQWIVGSIGYPLMDWVLVPYTHQNLTWTQHAFNEKIGEVQKVSREAFVRLKGRWKCLQKRTEVKLQDLPVVLGACCALHNICEIRKEAMDSELRFELVDDEMVPENSLRSVTSMQARDTIAHNLLHRHLVGTSFF